MLTLSIAFVLSFLFTLLVIRYSSVHAHITADWDLSGVQKFHARPVPRVGGLGIALALVGVSIALFFLRDSKALGFPYLLLLCSATPAFAAGFIEDLTKRVSPRERLIATMISAVLAAYLLDARIVRIDVHYLDMALALPLLSGLITVFAVAGVANAINIIDGFNGLASMVAMLMFVSLAYVSFQVSDPLIITVAFAMVGAILGFFIWNFPAGHIFLGDGGAYLIGFVLAECGILLVMRNPQVSAWYPVLMLIYPIFETLFSIYRRRVLKGVPAGYPDGVHLHTLIYQRLMRWAVGSKDERNMLRRNSMTSPYLWLLSLMAVLPATLFWNNRIVLLIFIGLFIILYVWLYWRIVRFQSPRWMIIKR
ncbi:UDP-N-acetylmuramyl pentapeptide phosphotransferase/UDP-N-acetylglucosamine-1-phosphate transferase [Cupriavidus sp. OV038]|jgi:UDP-N-acetylmuramyl pentapeptide phosphotransferase/UDP-N-acetylglucosamine-1-phosphate transferase|uniref:MraY family glycosyltransferase n=1 Tax=unclassified Cupriavidus TaxID=2640874 RepID=UPI0008E72506|nr:MULTISPECIES: glycosyltransferase [unclassified Cupriavidus]SFB78904.1 UDP-N-acetylmuramyl pentapeptide phosphotransferase/UDP-N-acetylglucosamine-1-phosphate transferase [Cupriavidus sp. OV038]SFO65774.1 UDP-N-acetylmuramyl pentapeptide phosphotransferase/UDP-N-acetylglucosamine-1-phosphate transferase [Cupriavidus sp. OV096]